MRTQLLWLGRRNSTVARVDSNYYFTLHRLTFFSEHLSSEECVALTREIYERLVKLQLLHKDTQKLLSNGKIWICQLKDQEGWILINWYFPSKSVNSSKEEAAVCLTRNLETFSTSTLIALSTISGGSESLIGKYSWEGKGKPGELCKQKVDGD